MRTNVILDADVRATSAGAAFPAGARTARSTWPCGPAPRSGKIRPAGFSHPDADRIRAARRILGDRLVSVQNRYSPAVRAGEAELRLYAELGLAFPPWSPLGGIWRSSLDGPSRVADARPGACRAVAQAHGVSPRRMALPGRRPGPRE
ncbi:aldo/keto reductase [Streptomyces sp. bgisy027]|uniref:aldo/keto reductase n=1 Tax=Streptomyces sp. bgisy027 TaxID=3413770 RepID=UPI003D7159A9